MVLNLGDLLVCVLSYVGLVEHGIPDFTVR